MLHYEILKTASFWKEKGAILHSWIMLLSEDIVYQTKIPVWGVKYLLVNCWSENPQKLHIPNSTSVQTTVLEGAMQTPEREKVSIVLTSRKPYRLECCPVRQDVPTVVQLAATLVHMHRAHRKVGLAVYVSVISALLGGRRHCKSYPTKRKFLAQYQLYFSISCIQSFWNLQ